MDSKIAAGCGCLLGMAAGDAMGNTIENKTWDEICENYGPNGLLGYDLANDAANITSYTQIAAFMANGLLLGAIRGKPEQYSRYLAVGIRDWAKSQQFRGPVTERTYCWLAQVPNMRRRHCMDTRMLDALNRNQLGTPEKPVFRSLKPSALTAAVAVGLCQEAARLTDTQVARLGAEAVAFTHGEPEAFLSGAFLALVVAKLLQDPRQKIITLYEQVCDQVEAQFLDSWPQVTTVTDLVRRAIAFSRDPELTPLAVMTMLGCVDAHECLAGAVYTTVIHFANFDEAMIASVNHSGRSSAVAAIAGAILGARLGVEALPEFYMESLEPTAVLRELATDLFTARQVTKIFDDSWDQKYVQGMPAH